MLTKKDKQTMIELLDAQYMHYSNMRKNNDISAGDQLVYYSGIETAYNQLLLAAGTGEIITRLDNGKHQIVKFGG